MILAETDIKNARNTKLKKKVKFSPIVSLFSLLTLPYCLSVMRNKMTQNSRKVIANDDLVKFFAILLQIYKRRQNNGQIQN